MPQGRLTIEEVVDAYEKTGLSPKTGSIIPADKGCCVVSVFNVLHNGVGGYEYIEKAYGFHYAEGLWHGFDGWKNNRDIWTEEFQDRYQLGYDDGCAFRKYFNLPVPEFIERAGL